MLRERLAKASLMMKIVTMVSLAVFLTSIGIGIVEYFYFSRQLDEQAKKEVAASARVVESQFRAMKDKVQALASMLANSPGMSEAVKEKKIDTLKETIRNALRDREGMFITILDKDGTVILRGHSD